jgi:TetR/AcrR family transcriptional repressor of nem operon
MKKSKEEAAETRRRIVATAAMLFMERGTMETAIGDVMQACGLTQGGFYRHFDAKEQLLVEAIQFSFDRLISSIEAAMLNRNASDALNVFFDLYLRQSEQGQILRCPIATLGSELMRCSPQLKQVFSNGYGRLEHLAFSQLLHIDESRRTVVAHSIISSLIGGVIAANSQETLALRSALHEKTLMGLLALAATA